MTPINNMPPLRVSETYQKQKKLFDRILPARIDPVSPALNGTIRDVVSLGRFLEDSTSSEKREKERNYMKDVEDYRQAAKKMAFRGNPQTEPEPEQAPPVEEENIIAVEQNLKPTVADDGFQSFTPYFEPAAASEE